MTTQNIYSMVDTWNAAGTTFKGISLDVTDTASGALVLEGPAVWRLVASGVSGGSADVSAQVALEG